LGCAHQKLWVASVRDVDHERRLGTRRLNVDFAGMICVPSSLGFLRAHPL
jgi:hypothetical protein